MNVDPIGRAQARTIFDLEQPVWSPGGVPHAAGLSFGAKPDQRLLKLAKEPDLNRLIDLTFVHRAQSQAAAG